MCFRSATKALVTAVALGAALGGCSDIYFDRRESISLASGEAMAANRVTHTIDPWSPASANRNITHDGERMQTAAERYRTGCVLQPRAPTTVIDSTADNQAKPEAQCKSNSQASSAPAAQVGGGKP